MVGLTPSGNVGRFAVCWHNQRLLDKNLQFFGTNACSGARNMIAVSNRFRDVTACLRLELGARRGRRALVGGLGLLRVGGKLPAVHPHRVRQNVARAAQLHVGGDTMSPHTFLLCRWQHGPRQTRGCEAHLETTGVYRG